MTTTETRADDVTSLRAQLDELNAEVRAPRSVAVVRSEPRVYGPASDASYFQDIALVAASNVAGAAEASDRLIRYASELDAEIARRSEEGLRAERIAAWVNRSGRRVETRAGSSSTIAGFTTPEYLIQDWAAYRLPTKSFTDQTTKLPLTPYGLQINVPSFTGPTTNAQQTENYGVTVSSPSGENIQVNLVTIAGEVPISQQLSDRGGLSGLAFDKIVVAQLTQNQDAAVDTYVINQATAAAYTATWSTTASWTNFIGDLGLARAGLADTAGTRMLATHLFTTTDQLSYWTSQVDSQNRPILTPDSSALVEAAKMGDPKWRSWSGIHLGSLAWHTDDNIPANGSNTQLLVCRPQEIYTFDGENYAFAYPQTSAGTLTVQIGLRTYVGAVVRFPKSVANISSAAYPTSNV